MERQEQSVREPEDLGSCVLKCLERGWGDRKGRIGKGGDRNGRIGKAGDRKERIGKAGDRKGVAGKEAVGQVTGWDEQDQAMQSLEHHTDH